MCHRRRSDWFAVGTLLLLALLLPVGAGEAQSAGDLDAPELQPTGVQDPRFVTEYGEIESVPSVASGAECHRQRVVAKYEDRPKKPFITFTGTKTWCYDGQRVTRGDMEVEAWIRPSLRRSSGGDGYVYVPSGLREKDQFVTFNGRPNGGHQSIRIGRFEYRARGLDGPAQVLNPYVSRTGRYDGSCKGPKPKDVSPRVTRKSPEDGTRNVSATANVEATFSEEMDPRTIDSSTFFLKKRNSFDPVEASYRYDARRRKATLDPKTRLEPGTYSASLLNGPYGTLTAAGDPIAYSETWTFSVGK